MRCSQICWIHSSVFPWLNAASVGRRLVFALRNGCEAHGVGRLWHRPHVSSHVSLIRWSAEACTQQAPEVCEVCEGVRLLN